MNPAKTNGLFDVGANTKKNPEYKRTGFMPCFQRSEALFASLRFLDFGFTAPNLALACRACP
jgi:hypothetical protein